jgi:hypothetical protein
VEYPYGLEYVEYGVCECGDGFGMVVGWNMLEEWWMMIPHHDCISRVFSR